jgi:transposase InsO family protein
MVAALWWVMWAVWTLIGWCRFKAQAPRRGWRHPRPASAVRGAPKPLWVIDEVIRLSALMPDAGCRHVADVFNRLHVRRRAVSVSKSFVAYTLRANRHAVLAKRRELKARVPRPMLRNRVWGVDLTGKADAHGIPHAMLGIVDHGSRRLLELRVLPRRCAWTLLGHLCLAIERHGQPRAVRTDNEAVFTGRVFSTALRLLGIAHQRTTPGCPWQNGRIERLFGTLKGRLGQWRFVGAVQLQLALGEFATWYNEVRLHRHLQSATPMEAWQGIDPFAQAPRHVEWFEAWEGLLTGYRLRR